MKMESEYVEALSVHMQETCFAQCVKTPGSQKDLTGDEVCLLLHTVDPEWYSHLMLATVEASYFSIVYTVE